MVKEMYRVYNFNRKEMKFNECLFTKKEHAMIFLKACKEMGVDVTLSKQTYKVEVEQ